MLYGFLIPYSGMTVGSSLSLSYCEYSVTLTSLRPSASNLSNAFHIILCYKVLLKYFLGSVNSSRILSAFKSSCIPGVLQQLQVSMVAHNGCLRKLCLWFICASRVVGKLIFKSVVGKQNSTVIYHTLPPSQL